VRKTDTVLRCASGVDCVSYPTLGEPSKLSQGNPGPRCFACEKQRRDFEGEGVAAKPKAAKPKAAKPREVKRPSRSEDYEPEVLSSAEVSRASAIWKRRRASVLTCERGLQSAIDSDDARLMRTWSKSLRDAETRLLWAEAELEAFATKAWSEQRR
jgi:hypothetical protein